MKTMLTGGNDGSLKLEDRFVAQTRGVRQIASGAPDGGNKPFVRIHANRNLVREVGHG